ncbi:PepSY-associated TM helix domain-containing protein [Aestuariivirga sp.]|uniref:PepSY-associated TM helix domain-containing protein n=1 Tax=Aestuariivirga sp. TaxID=2650926 RepID=UPI0039E49FFD
MSVSALGAERAASAASSSRLYRAVWRWHFYAGLYVAPFLFMLALSGLIMVYGNSIETFLGKKYYVTPGGERALITDQASLAEQSVPGGKLTLFVNPATDDRANIFIVTGEDGKERVVAVDPHGPKVMGSIVKDDTWFYWADRLHGSLFIAPTTNGLGDRLIEVAAGLGILLILTGLYMWWPGSAQEWRATLLPNLSLRGRALWKELHGSIGFYISIVLLFFFISGLSWAGIWGGKYVQAWSTFPAEKWDNVPLAELEARRHEPWRAEGSALDA